MAEESLDNEAIQARIELSLSLAQDLVSSWVKPYETTSKSKNFEEELKDYLRRPPRLGLGTIVPESSTVSTSREAARLRGQLVGKGRKRQREESPEDADKQDDDEEESRAGAIVKKSRTDWFSNVLDGSKGKKGKAPSTPSTLSRAELPSPYQSLPFGDNLSEEVITNPIVSSTDSTTVFASESNKKKKKKKKRPKDTEQYPAAAPPSHTLPLLQVESHSLPANPPKPATSTPTASPNKHRNAHAALLKHPILVLDGPQQLSLLEGPRNKRRKRKKKRHSTALDGETGQAAS